MGGPLSMIASEVFMNRLETDILNTFANRHYIRFWARYVDILCVWSGTEGDLQSLLEELNGYHPSVSFTLEIGGDQISFLDLRITLYCVPLSTYTGRIPSRVYLSTLPPSILLLTSMPL